MVCATPLCLILHAISLVAVIITMIYHIYAIKQCNTLKDELVSKYEKSLKDQQATGNAAAAGNGK